MIIKIDNREQGPLAFHHKLIKSVENATIKCGDYGCLLPDIKR